jgi:putative Ca2+/H+ antiporter (TMEM165/GDT1 family)
MVYYVVLTKPTTVHRAQALCTTAAVMGGKSLASQISEKMVGLSSGVLFLLFGIMSYLSGPEGEL